MKIALLGSEGMLGSDLQKVLVKRGHEVFPFTREALDITDLLQIDKLADCKPEIIINCAAYTNVERAEDQPEACLAVNTEAVKSIVKVAKNIGATLVQISTDYVFDGDQGEYDEKAKKNPLSIYGRSKSEAEDLIVAEMEKFYIVRTAWLYGEQGKNFVDTVLRICKEKGEMKIVKDQVGCPTYTVDLADAIASLLGMTYGVYHLTNTGKCTWYAFACEIAEKAQIPCILRPCSSAEFPQKAQRPRSSVLLNTKVTPLRPWQSALTDYINKKYQI